MLPYDTVTRVDSRSKCPGTWYEWSIATVVGRRPQVDNNAIPMEERVCVIDQPSCGAYFKKERYKTLT
eukprot:COSAG06_NODE_12786_length_1330_cov_1.123477_2_plen_67_part_01